MGSGTSGGTLAAVNADPGVAPLRPRLVGGMMTP